MRTAWRVQEKSKKIKITGWANLSAQTRWFLNTPTIFKKGGVFIWLTKDKEEAVKVFRNLNFWKEGSGDAKKVASISLLLSDSPNFQDYLFNLLNKVGI